MARIAYSSRACSDIEQIACYIASDNPAAADRWLDSIDRTLDLIGTQPLTGQKVDHLMPGLRCHSHGQYVLYYKLLDDGLLLHRVLHGARKIEDIFD